MCPKHIFIILTWQHVHGPVLGDVSGLVGGGDGRGWATLFDVQELLHERVVGVEGVLVAADR